MSPICRGRSCLPIRMNAEAATPHISDGKLHDWRGIVVAHRAPDAAGARFPYAYGWEAKATNETMARWEVPVTKRILLACALALASGRMAQAQPACSSLPNPVYLQIGDTQENLIKALGFKLRNQTSGAMTIIYKLNGSCTNIDNISNNTPITTNPNFIPTATNTTDPGYVAGWMPSMASPTCTIDTGGHPIELANSNVLISACTQTPPPSTIGIFQGPIQGYVFAV